MVPPSEDPHDELCFFLATFLFVGMWFFGLNLVAINVITLKCFSIPKALRQIK